MKKKLNFKNGDVYEGEIDTNNILSGLGEYKFSTGAIYRGQFLSGKFNGEGILID